MIRSTLFVVLAGVALATPVSARERQKAAPECPEMPTSHDFEKSREGGLSVQIGGIGGSANRTKNVSRKDVLIREGGFTDWSAAAVLANRCLLDKDLYPHDPARRRDSFAAERERLLGRPAPVSPRRAPSVSAPVAALQARSSSVASWHWSDTWQALSTTHYFPKTALRYGIKHGDALVDCRLSRDKGLDDCRVISESPAGYGFGDAVLRYTRALRLNERAKSGQWKAKRVRWKLGLRAN